MQDDTQAQETHVSQWPSYDIKPEQQLRPLAVWNDATQEIITQDGEVIPYTTPQDFIKFVSSNRYIVFTENILTQFEPMESLIKDNRCKFCCSRTGGFFAILIKSRTTGWVVQRSVWDGGTGMPDSAFLDAVGDVFNRVQRSAATPGSLGERLIQEKLPHGTRFNRPGVMLRTVLLINRIGGRADLCTDQKNYPVLYESDITSAYTYCSKKTIDPGEHPKRFWGEPERDYFSYYARITFELRGDRKLKFGPLAVRTEEGKLDFITQCNEEHEGWYWKEEIDRARNAGYTVTIHEGYGWLNSSNWLEEWANYLHKLKEESSGKTKEIFKKMAVAAIGRFSRSPEKLELVHSDDRVKGQTYVPVINSTAGVGESPISDYFIHIQDDSDSNSLTHVGSYIIMKCRCELYDRIIEEEQLGGTVVMTNYDAYYLLKESKILDQKGKGLGHWKETVITDVTIYGSRSIAGKKKGTPFDHRPGVPLKKRNTG